MSNAQLASSFSIPFRRVIALLLVTAIFVGCRSTTPTSTESTPAAPAAAAVPDSAQSAPSPTDATDSRPLLLCFGDSLTEGHGVDPWLSYPADLQKRLDAAGWRYHVVNAGISGNTTKDGVERLPRVLARHAAIVVVEFGGNDGLRGLPLEQTQANLATIISSLQASGAKVALAGITLPPDYGPDYIAHINAMYRSLAKRFHVPLLPFLLQGVYGVPGGMQADQTHATAAGNQQVARNVEALVRPLLRH